LKNTAGRKWVNRSTFVVLHNDPSYKIKPEIPTKNPLGQGKG